MVFGLFISSGKSLSAANAGSVKHKMAVADMVDNSFVGFTNKPHWIELHLFRTSRMSRIRQLCYWAQYACQIEFESIFNKIGAWFLSDCVTNTDKVRDFTWSNYRCSKKSPAMRGHIQSWRQPDFQSFCRYRAGISKQEYFYILNIS